MTRIALALVLLGMAPLGGLARAQDDHGSHGHAHPRIVDIVVNNGYRPSTVTLREGEQVHLRFVRHEDTTCTREVVFPALGIRRELPPHQPVVIELPPLRAGRYEFRCGMNMVRGELVVEAR